MSTISQLQLKLNCFLKFIHSILHRLGSLFRDSWELKYFCLNPIIYYVYGAFWNKILHKAVAKYCFSKRKIVWLAHKDFLFQNYTNTTPTVAILQNVWFLFLIIIYQFIHREIKTDSDSIIAVILLKMTSLWIQIQKLKDEIFSICPWNLEEIVCFIN